jgi:hypothetical protein
MVVGELIIDVIANVSDTMDGLESVSEEMDATADSIEEATAVIEEVDKATEHWNMTLAEAGGAMATFGKNSFLFQDIRDKIGEAADATGGMISNFVTMAAQTVLVGSVVAHITGMSVAAGIAKVAIVKLTFAMSLLFLAIVPLTAAGIFGAFAATLEKAERAANGTSGMLTRIQQASEIASEAWGKISAVLGDAAYGLISASLLVAANAANGVADWLTVIDHMMFGWLGTVIMICVSLAVVIAAYVVVSKVLAIIKVTQLAIRAIGLWHVLAGGVRGYIASLWAAKIAQIGLNAATVFFMALAGVGIALIAAATMAMVAYYGHAKNGALAAAEARRVENEELEKTAAYYESVSERGKSALATLERLHQQSRTPAEVYRDDLAALEAVEDAKQDAITATAQLREDYQAAWDVWQEKKDRRLLTAAELTGGVFAGGTSRDQVEVNTDEDLTNLNILGERYQEYMTLRNQLIVESRDLEEDAENARLKYIESLGVGEYFEKQQTDMEKLSDQADILNDLFREGAIEGDEFVTAVARIEEAYRAATRAALESTDAWKAAQQIISDSQSPADRYLERVDAADRLLERALIDGMQYGNEISNAMEKFANDLGLGQLIAKMEEATPIEELANLKDSIHEYAKATGQSADWVTEALATAEQMALEEQTGSSSEITAAVRGTTEALRAEQRDKEDPLKQLPDLQKENNDINGDIRDGVNEVSKQFKNVGAF